MAGPVVGVLLREPLIKTQLKEMDQWLRSVATRVDGTQGRRGEWELWMDGAPVGCSSGEPQCTIIVSVQGSDPYAFGLDPLEAPEYTESIRVAIGHHLTQEIMVIAMCNHRIDHCLIGRLALHFAHQFGGVINMNGTITPPIRVEQRSAVDHWPYSTLDEVRTFLRGIPGRVWEITSGEGGDDPKALPLHVVDAVFLENWLRHPHFHMIK